MAENHDDYTGMGTTVVCALITGIASAFGHVGDSRLTMLSGGVFNADAGRHLGGDHLAPGGRRMPRPWRIIRCGTC